MRIAVRFRPLPGLTLAALPAFFVLIALGVWQCQRLAWKVDLIATIHERVGLAPVPVEALEAAPLDLRKIMYRPVVAAGRFDHAATRYLFVGSGPGGAPGFHILTPLRRAAGPTILVDRGFIPQSLRAPDSRPGSEPVGLVTVQGVIRLDEPATGFVPHGEQVEKVWYSRDLSGIGEAMGLPLTPFLIEADATPNPTGWPLGGQTTIELRNPHLGYAITWFGLAIALVVIYLLYHHRSGRLSLREE